MGESWTLANLSMNIAFVGDSFCQNATLPIGKRPNPYVDWPGIVAEALNANILQEGYGGKHFYSAVIDFLPKMFDVDVAIFCVSEPFRVISSRYSLPINFTWSHQMHSKTGNHWERRQETADENNIPLSEMLTVAEATHDYYKYLFDQSSLSFLQVGLVSYIDSLMKQHNKKAIWFPCFTQSFSFADDPWGDAVSFRKVTGKHFIPMSGPSGNIPLHDLSVAELKHEKNTPKKIKQIVNNDTRRNHFNNENNCHMAELVLDVIRPHLDIIAQQHDALLPGVIKMEKYFSHMNLDDVEIVRT